MDFLELFIKFFKLGISGWGGPIGRIALLHEELVVKEKWIDEKKFAKVLAVYQALPGPEATELACYFGYSRMGRAGSVIAGLGFMLPGFILMLVLAHFYLAYGLKIPAANAILYGMKPAIVALILAALWKLGKENVTDWKLFAIATASCALFLSTRIDFLIVLFAGGIISLALYCKDLKEAGGKTISMLALPIMQVFTQMQPSGVVFLFLFFLKAGLLTYGGAYSVVAFVQQGAVYDNKWLTNEQFADGLALGAVIPAPVVMIGTFAGYIAGGIPGAVLATIGIFLPAFAFTLIGYEEIEKVIGNKKLQFFLSGLVAATMGLIAAAWAGIASVAIIDVPALAIAVVALYLITRKFNFFVTIIGCAAAGLVLKMVLA